MKECWAEAPYERPSFSTLIEMIDRVLNNESDHGYIELDVGSTNYAHV